MRPAFQLTVWLMAGAGLRVSEALAVTEDSLRGDTLRVWQQVSSTGAQGGYHARLAPLKHRKEGEYREIPLPSFLVDKFYQHTAEHGTATIGDQEGILFRATTGGLCVQQAYRRVWTQALQHAGLTSYTPHDLRHFFVSSALAGDVSLLEVSRWIGHKSIKVTADTYGHLTEGAPGRLRQALQSALDPSGDV
nr:site-specific integrase [Actinopolyspora halophila]